jgi:hypothetical protein
MRPETAINIRPLAGLLAFPLLLATILSGVAHPVSAAQRGFVFPATSTWHAGDRLQVRWHGASARATAHVVLYGPFMNVTGLKKNPHSHFVTASHVVHGKPTKGVVRISLKLPRTARKGYYDLYASATERFGESSSSAGGDSIIWIASR